MEELQERWPLHMLVWNNMHEELKDVLEQNERGIARHKLTDTDLETQDPRGRTPLMLAVVLVHIECVRVLLQAGANVNCDKDGWTVLQEAVSTGSAELVGLVLERRDSLRQTLRSDGVPLLLGKLSEAPDFYVEMKWQFASWVPLVSRMCPFDTYKVYKQGSNVRIDTTLLGFELNKWTRGKRTYIFKGRGASASMIEIDHEGSQFWEETFEVLSNEERQRTSASVSEEAVEMRLNNPICVNYLDTEKISFARNKSGIWGWRHDKTENVNGYECKVFGANNVEFVSKTRTEHLAGSDLERALTPSTSRPPILNLFAMADTHENAPLISNDNEESSSFESNPCKITAEDYFSDKDLNGHDIGRTKEMNSKTQKFRATLWLCETYPLQLQEQILPILDLMATMSSPHFAKLKDFIEMQLPSGFPVKIEIPMYHVLNVQITFSNIFAMDEPVSGVSSLSEGERLSCVVDDSCFSVPPTYTHIGADEDRRAPAFEDEEELLQYAIQQSLMDTTAENERVDIWEALRAERPSRPVTPNLLNEEDRQLQRAIQASLESASSSNLVLINPGNNSPPSSSSDDIDPELEAAIRLSRQELSKHRMQRQQEDDELEKILKLSLIDK